MVLSILLAVYMLAHALLPVLPAYVCTDGGRSLTPCSPTELHAMSVQDELHLPDCCKLAAGSTIDAQPPLLISSSVPAADLVATTHSSCHSCLVPHPSHLNRLAHRNRVLRGPPPLLHTVLRI